MKGLLFGDNTSCYFCQASKKWEVSQALVLMIQKQRHVTKLLEQ